MLKQIITIFILFSICSSAALSYEMYTPASYRYYNNGTYENMNKRRTKFYNNYIERNKHECEKYYCLIPDNSDRGYKIHKSAFGACGYEWQEFMGVRERVRCHRTEDHIPVVRSFDEAKNYKD